MKNLDTMEPDELMAFWAKHQRGQAYRELFPQGGMGAKLTTAALANYASNRATAMQCRARGQISVAKGYENICDRIYQGLPAHARW